jgi:hypothetical protein
MPQREGNTAAALPSMLPSAFVMNYEHSTLHVEHCTLTSRRAASSITQLDAASWRRRLRWWRLETEALYFTLYSNEYGVRGPCNAYER